MSYSDGFNSVAQLYTMYNKRKALEENRRQFDLQMAENQRLADIKARQFQAQLAADKARQDSINETSLIRTDKNNEAQLANTKLNIQGRLDLQNDQQDYADQKQKELHQALLAATPRDVVERHNGMNIVKTPYGYAGVRPDGSYVQLTGQALEYFTKKFGSPNEPTKTPPANFTFDFGKEPTNVPTAQPVPQLTTAPVSQPTTAPVPQQPIEYQAGRNVIVPLTGTMANPAGRGSDVVSPTAGVQRDLRDAVPVRAIENIGNGFAYPIVRNAGKGSDVISPTARVQRDLRDAVPVRAIESMGSFPTPIIRNAGKDSDVISPMVSTQRQLWDAARVATRLQNEPLPQGHAIESGRKQKVSYEVLPENSNAQSLTYQLPLADANKESVSYTPVPNRTYPLENQGTGFPFMNNVGKGSDMVVEPTVDISTLTVPNAPFFRKAQGSSSMPTAPSYVPPDLRTLLGERDPQMTGVFGASNPNPMLINSLNDLEASPSAFEVGTKIRQAFDDPSAKAWREVAGTEKIADLKDNSGLSLTSPIPLRTAPPAPPKPQPRFANQAQLDALWGNEKAAAKVAAMMKDPDLYYQRYSPKNMSAEARLSQQRIVESQAKITSDYIATVGQQEKEVRDRFERTQKDIGMLIGGVIPQGKNDAGISLSKQVEAGLSLFAHNNPDLLDIYDPQSVAFMQEFAQTYYDGLNNGRGVTAGGAFLTTLRKVSTAGMTTEEAVNLTSYHQEAIQNLTRQYMSEGMSPQQAEAEAVQNLVQYSSQFRTQRGYADALSTLF